ncbi:type II pantothenate kinase [bacterium]|nr:type II pantothenate kinase [bacterium]
MAADLNIDGTTSSFCKVLDLTGAVIASSDVPQEDAGKDQEVSSKRDGVPSISLPSQSSEVRHFAMDMGGSLVKIVYFSPDSENVAGMSPFSSPLLGGGRLHFRKFEASKMDQCIKFIEQKQLHLGTEGGKAVVKATGGGAFKNTKLFQDRFGIQLQKEDEMKCAVAGANFLLQTIRDEAFTFTEGKKDFVVHKDGQQGGDDLFPYLLVNIGSGVSIIKVDSDGFERVGGTNIGGGTFWGLCRLLTGLKDFDQMLACSAGGDNSKVDMLVGDIYGGRDYAKVGLSSNTIASSFGQVVMDEGSLEDYDKADITLSLLRMISYNISHIATMTAVKHGLKRIFFGGYFIRGHAYTMNTISFAVDYWSKGELKAMFLRHEGFLGALGAFLQDADAQALRSAPLQGAWIEKFIKCSIPPMKRATSQDDSCHDDTTGVGDNNAEGIPVGSGAASLAEATRKMVMHVRSMSNDNNEPAGISSNDYEACETSSKNSQVTSSSVGTYDSTQNQLLGKASLQVGVLHLVPTLKLFPLLRWPDRYEPNIIDMLESREEREYWLDILQGMSPGLVEKAVASDALLRSDTDSVESDAIERGEAFRSVFSAHLDRLREEPAAYGRIGLSGLFEMREECLRAFGFKDAYFDVKQQENAAALAVLPDLLAELDALEEGERRLLALVEGVLAGNIFDWGSQSCVDLYKNGTILEIYRNARSSIARPWAVDCFDELSKKMLWTDGQSDNSDARFGTFHKYRKALLFCDNSGADVVLGMIPFARELLRHGTDVCLVANSLPAINDITVDELRDVVLLAAEKCDILAGALHGEESNEGTFGKLTVCASGSGSPCIDFRRTSQELCESAEGVDLIVLEGMGRAVHTNYAAQFQCDTLKLAMLKNARLAERLFHGRIYDCICKFETYDQRASM